MPDPRALTAGCTATTPGTLTAGDPGPESTTPAWPTHTPEAAAADNATSGRAEPRLSERGLIPSQLGQEVRLDIPGSDEAAIRFTITSAEAVDSCDEATRYTPATRPENGHFLRLHIEAHTGRSYSHDINRFLMPQWIDEQGITHNQAQTCAVMM
jgi:hypothetical protein